MKLLILPPKKEYDKYKLGQLYSTKKSFMFSFENNEWHKYSQKNIISDLLENHRGEDEQLTVALPHLHTAFMGVKNKQYVFDIHFSDFLHFEKPISIKSGRTIENTILTEYDGVKYFFVDRKEPINYRTFDLVMKLNGK